MTARAGISAGLIVTDGICKNNPNRQENKMAGNKMILKAAFAALLLVCAGAFGITDDEIEKIQSAMPKEAFVKPGAARKMLVFSLCNGFRHDCIAYWKKSLETMAEKTGAFSVEFSDDMSAFSAENLGRFDAVCLNNTTKLTFTEEQKAAFLKYLENGGGLVGIHAATDNFYDWPQAAHIIGGRFSGHPWTANGTWAVKIDVPGHPLTKMFEGGGFKINDEIYRTAAPFYSRDNRLVLMSLDMSDEATKNAKGVTPEDSDTGISWINRYGKGRVFYCSLGHNPEIVWNAAVLEHYLAGIQFAMGDLDVPDVPAAAVGLTGQEKERLGQFVSAVSKYDWKDSRVVLTELEEFIMSCRGNSAGLAEIEQSMLTVLAAKDTTPAAKDFICRQLSIYGTEAGADALGAMLKDAQTADMARYALERIPGNKVDEVLLAALVVVEDKTKIGITSTLANRGCARALKPLAELAGNENQAVAAAAISAIGRIGGKEAADILSGWEGKVSPELQVRLLESSIVCADGLKDRTMAAKIYQRLYEKKDFPLIRAAAFCGLFKCSTDNAAALIIKGLKDNDQRVQTTAVGLVKGLKGKDITAVISGAGELSQTHQIQLLAALGQAADAAGLGYALKSLGSGDGQVRLASIDTLAVIGDVSAIEPLAQAGAGGDKEQKDAARQALSIIDGADADKKIVRLIESMRGQNGKEGIRTELIFAAGQRRIRDALDVIIEEIKGPDGQVRQQAARSLGEIAVPADMPALAKLLAERPEAAVQDVVLSVALKQPQRKGRAKVLNEYSREISDTSVLKAFLSVLGRTGDPDSLEALKEWSESKDAGLSDAAFRAMCDWPGDELIEQMFFYSQSKDSRMSVLAIRSGIRMTGASENKSCSEKVELLKKFFLSASRVEEKRLVLGAYGLCICPEAVAAAGESIEQADLAAEAQNAVLSILDKKSGRMSEAEKGMLIKIAGNGANETIVQKSADLLKRVK